MPGTDRAHIFGLEIRADDVLVDVGSGPGNDCVLAGSVGADVIAVNVNSVELELLAQKMQHVPARSFRAVQNSSEQIPLEAETATVVLAKEVMEHVDDPVLFLSELARIGKPGARYLISVPDPRSEALLKISAPAWFWEKPFHIHIFEPERLARLIEAAGLRMERRAYCGFYDVMAWCFRLAAGVPPPNHADWGKTPAPLLEWEKLWKTIAESGRGPEIVAMLDQVLPKSQIIFAQKPRPAEAASARGDADEPGAGLRARRSRVGVAAGRWLASNCGFISKSRSREDAENAGT